MKKSFKFSDFITNQSKSSNKNISSNQSTIILTSIFIILTLILIQSSNALDCTSFDAEIQTNISNNTAIVNQSILFEAITCNGINTTYSWNLGDGQESTLQNISKKYLTKGNYTIILNVTSQNSALKESKIRNYFLSIKENDNTTTNNSLNNSFNSSFNSSSNSSSNKTDELELSIKLSKTNFVLGESGNINIIGTENSSLVLTIEGPDDNIFQATYFQFSGEETETLITTKPGLYKITANITKDNTSLYKKENYTVADSLIIDFEIPELLYKFVNETIEASAEGGIIPYTYEWKYKNIQNIIKTGKTITINFTETGNKWINLTVKDDENNTKFLSKQVTIKELNKLTIKVVDKKTKNPIKNAEIEINDHKQETDSTGKTIFNLKDGRYEIFGYKDDYGFYIDRININSDEEIIIELSLLDLAKPKINILSKILDKKVLKIEFQVEDESDSTCDLYIKENSEWEKKLKTILKVNPNKTYKFEAEVKEDNPSLRIECKDENSNIGEIKFNLNEEATITSKTTESTLSTTQSTTEGLTDYQKEGYLTLRNFLLSIEGLSIKEKEAIDDLGIKRQLELATRDIERAQKDLVNTDYRTLSNEEKNQRYNELLERINKIIEETPTGLIVQESSEFVVYPNKEELKNFLKNYYDFKKISYSERQIERILSDFEKLQGKLTTSTKTKNIVLKYFSGKEEKFTLVSKKIETSKLTENIKLVEFIPEEIVKSEDIILISEPKTFENNLMFFENNQESIIYKIESYRNLDLIEKTITVFVSENLQTTKTNAITGLVSGGLGTEGKYTLLVILIIILALFYIVNTFEILEKIPLLTNSFGKVKKKIHYINILINDVDDQLKEGDYEKAALIYKEIRLTYNNLKNSAKSKCYESIIKIYEELNKAYLSKTITKIRHSSGEEKIILSRIAERTFEKLNDENKRFFKEMMHKIRGEL